MDIEYIDKIIISTKHIIRDKKTIDVEVVEMLLDVLQNLNHKKIMQTIEHRHADDDQLIFD